MKLSRLDGLSDGIFAIVMTLLIIEIRVPEFHQKITNDQLGHALAELAPLFLSYVLSFAMLYTYWRAHCFVISVAKNINIKLANYNALFLFFIGLIPFTTHLLGRYNYTQLAILLYGLNIILIGISVYMMRSYILKSDRIENMEVTSKSIRHSNIRLFVPVICAAIAMGLCFVNTLASMIVFTVLILFNLTPLAADFIDFLIRKTERNG